MINNTVLWNNYALRSSPTLREPYQSIDQWAGSIVLARNKERKDLWRQQ